MIQLKNVPKRWIQGFILALTFGLVAMLHLWCFLPKNSIRLWTYKNLAIYKLLITPPSFQRTSKIRHCKPRICSNVLEEAVQGYWSLQKGLTPERKEERKKMDELIRLKNEWPALLSRDDFRCGRNFTLPNHPRLHAQCDPDGPRPCCNYKSGRCGHTDAYCRCKDCTDARSTIPAEIGEWHPYNKDCQIKYFTQSEACNLLNKHVKHIVFLGDSLIRQLSTTLYLILSGNFETGGLPKSITPEDINHCKGEFQLTSKKCSMEIAAKSVAQLAHNALCEGKIDFQFDLVGDYVPDLSKYVIDKLEELLNKTDSYVVIGLGLHYQLSHERLVSLYLSKIFELLDQKGNGWPKFIWMGLHSENGFLRADTWGHNNQIKTFNNIIHQYLRRRNIPVIDTFEMATGIRSYDGRHYGIGFNMLKMHILLNYLEENLERC